MKSVAVLVLVVWLLVGVAAAYQRGDFGNGNCASVSDTAVVMVLGPVNYTVPETLDGNGNCVQPD